MATGIKFHQFVTDLCEKVHNLDGTDTLKIALTNTAPTAATDATLSDITQISYTNVTETWPADITNTGSGSSGTYTVAGSDVTATASGGSVGPFRYAVLYNDTPSSPTDPLIVYWDNGSEITLADGDDFVLDFGANIFTLT